MSSSANVDHDISIDDILKEIGPVKSEKAYNSLWESFLTFSSVSDATKLEEKEFIRYFHHLKSLGLKASSLWTKYSMLNNVYQRNTGQKLQRFPRLTMQLKSYQRGYVRKVAKVFTLQEFQTFIKMDLGTPYWIIRKAFAAIAWSGGLRCHELHRLKIENLHWSSEGCRISFTHSKQLAEEKENTILVPYNMDERSMCLASKIKTYLEALGDLATDASQPLFHGCPKNAFVKSPMGINVLRNIGKDVASLLRLPDANSYTGHSWRRSCATQVAAQGATSVDMKRQFGWRQETTAMRYIDKNQQHQIRMASMATGQPEANSKTVNSLQVGKDSLEVDQCPPIVKTVTTKESSSVTVAKMGSGSADRVYHITTGNNCTLNFC